MKLEEAKKVLLIIRENIEFELQFIYADKTIAKLKEYIQAIDTVIAELHALQNLLDEKNEEIYHLQKENEELKNGNKGFIPVKKIENKIREYFEYDKKYKTYTSDGRENYTYEYYKALTLQDLLREVFEND